MKQVLIIIASIVVIMAIIIGVLIMSNEHSNNTPTAATSTTSGNTPTMADGLKITDEKVGTGAVATANSTVTVDYTGTLADGTVFDASNRHGGPATFPLSNVIQGWQ